MRIDHLYQHGEEGTSVIEFVLVLSSLVLLIAIFISLGQTMILRQEGLVAARYAAFYNRASGSPATAQVISQAVSPQGEQWTVSVNPKSAGTGDLNQAFQDAQSNITNQAGLAGGVFSNLVNTLGSSGSLNVGVNEMPNRGLVPRMSGISNVKAVYSLANGTWNGNDLKSYMNLLTGDLGPLSSIL